LKLFDQLKEEQGKDIISKKVQAINGDVSLPDLGMSQTDRQILADNVHLVYHMAATIRFDEPLKKAVLLNTRGTKLILQLAKEMKKIEVSENY
jgi:alcohol-forming fatty acyl-CoA reductase